MMENSGEIINVGLAVEVVKWCDELCLGWKSANECRGHLDKVKAQSYIDKYEMKLCEAGMTCETSFQNVQALISVAKDARVNPHSSLVQQQQPDCGELCSRMSARPGCSPTLISHAPLWIHH